MDIMEKEVFVWCKKREKRTTLLCEKETRLQQSKVHVKTISLSFSLFLSSLFLSLSLSFTPLFVVLLFVSSERAHDVQWKLTPSTSASIRALLASSSTTKYYGRRRRRNFDRDEDEDDDRVSRARRRGKTTRNFLSLFRIGKRSFSFSRSRSLLNADAPLPSLSLYIYIRR